MFDLIQRSQLPQHHPASCFIHSSLYQSLSFFPIVVPFTLPSKQATVDVSRRAALMQATLNRPADEHCPVTSVNGNTPPLCD
jgi:hypothetical protein